MVAVWATWSRQVCGEGAYGHGCWGRLVLGREGIRGLKWGAVGVWLSCSFPVLLLSHHPLTLLPALVGSFCSLLILFLGNHTLPFSFHEKSTVTDVTVTKLPEVAMSAATASLVSLSI